ncbi:MAG: KH domain-containing protein [Rhabdochlamydiaceae bacterium]|nr:KH domain-containing protein [Candidatus Amphrikana amoebophyrae]
MKEFIAYLIKNLVDDPEIVDVNVFDGDKSTIIEVKVGNSDVAKVVGRQGRTIKALRTVAMTVGARFGRRVKVELIQDKG